MEKERNKEMMEATKKQEEAILNLKRKEIRSSKMYNIYKKKYGEANMVTKLILIRN